MKKNGIGIRKGKREGGAGKRKAKRNGNRMGMGNEISVRMGKGMASVF